VVAGDATGFPWLMEYRVVEYDDVATKVETHFQFRLRAFAFRVARFEPAAWTHPCSDSGIREHRR
jgi:hypothetical protein